MNEHIKAWIQLIICITFCALALMWAGWSVIWFMLTLILAAIASVIY
jgi:hypothetical protein